MDTDHEELSVVLPSTTTSGLSIALHPLPILNISEHFTRLKLQKETALPFTLGALLGTQNGREVEIVNSFELVLDGEAIDHVFLVDRRDQYKQTFPSLEFIGWYTVAPIPTSRHIELHSQFTGYCSTPLLLLLQPNASLIGSATDGTSQSIPFKAYEQTIEIRDRTSRSVFVEAAYNVETGEAERIAVDWTAKGGGSGTSLESHLQTQRAAVKMLHDRILMLVQYVTSVIAAEAPTDHGILRSISALIASLPATENKTFREEFKTESEDVQLTAFLASLTKSTNILNDLVDKHNLLTASRDDRYGGAPGNRRTRMQMGGARLGDWDRMH
ncbi:COP9 signalosome subunit 6 [Rhodocollybia butyracea]|uniref:COP9 signalosome complex subunit 6 n=1 Tax=Rhodocollybia butyracea TaxID=206335 RepID=A0A9P5Q2D2_9AGAR|nr:COP9 signalosome subunit 6 [Rhodocollybia butyracea]